MPISQLSMLVLPVPPRTVEVGSVLFHVPILIEIASIKSINVASSFNDQDQSSECMSNIKCQISNVKCQMPKVKIHKTKDKRQQSTVKCQIPM